MLRLIRAAKQKLHKLHKKIVFDICNQYDFYYTVHGELSVNLMDEKFFDDHKEILIKDIEVSGEIGATHLVTHFGYTSKDNYENKSKYEYLLKQQNDLYAEVAELANKNNATILITHYQRLLNEITPDFVHVMAEGKILRTGGKELALELEKAGYDWIDDEKKISEVK